MTSDTSLSQFRSAYQTRNEHAGSETHSSGVADQANGLADTSNDAAGALYAKGEEAVREAMDELPANLSDVAAAGERIATRGRQALDDGIRKQPVEALLLAGAIGYLVGWAINRG